MQTIKSRVASRALAAGERLPSIRSLAAQVGVSPSTVVEAYDRLVAEGVIRARRGSGFYVTTSAAAPLDLAQEIAPQERDIDPFWVSRQSLDADPVALKPGCGWLPPEWMPADAIRKGMRALARGGAEALVDYGSSRGSPELRRIIGGRLAADGVDASPDQIVLTPSGTNAIDLVCRFLLRPGDTVIVDDPCYFNFRALLRAHAVKIVGVPFTSDGPDIERFEAVLVAERPKLYVTNSALHNPTGAMVSARAAHRVLSAATSHDVTIVEDDIFADLAPEPVPHLAGLDGLSRVIRIGSFSKTVSASLRCGYIAARRDWIEGLIDLQIAAGFGGPSPVAAHLVASVLAGGGYRKHIEEVRRRLGRAQVETATSLSRIGIKPWIRPRGGFNLWGQLPEGVDSALVAQSALAQNVVLAPGNVYSASRTAERFMRFNVAQCSAPRIMTVIDDVMRSQRAQTKSFP
ncbi:PLP-dependent aminotransferase family protein [Pelagibacterium sp.]|uniref:aminotransferase-like domain-containing protein n=1 Tax=Pelagibacterium sp. TaxID=1967288 RepID=UPI003A92DCB9